ALLCRIDSEADSSVIIPTYGSGVQRWLLSTAHIFRTYGNDNSTWWRVAQFGPDETFVLGVDYYGGITVWEPRLSGELAHFDNLSWAVNDLQFIHDGRLLVLPAEDGTIRFWGILATD